MFRLLVVASAYDLEGGGPLDELRGQIEFVSELGVQVELLVDPSQAELETAIFEGSFDCGFSPICRCYKERDDGQIVPREYDIYAVLERLDQPFIGSTYFHSLLVDDKTLANGHHGLAPPGILVTRSLMQDKPAVARRRLEELQFPSIVKPNSLGGSLGIDSGAVVDDANAAFGRLVHLFDRFSAIDDARVERFLPEAREFTVAILGNDAAVATSVTEILKPDGPNEVYAELDKRTPAEQRRIAYATIDDGVLRGSLATLAHDVFLRFGLRDLARFDILVTDRPYLVDINVPPVLSNSFSHEWQMLYASRKSELLAFALAAFDARMGREGRPARLPAEVLAKVPFPIRRALRPIR